MGGNWSGKDGMASQIKDRDKVPRATVQAPAGTLDPEALSAPADDVDGDKTRQARIYGLDIGQAVPTRMIPVGSEYLRDRAGVADAGGLDRGTGLEHGDS